MRNHARLTHLVPLAFLILVGRAHAQDDPLRGTWLVRGQDDRGSYDGTLRFDRLEAGRYRARARLTAVGPGGVDRSYDAPAVLSSASTTGSLVLTLSRTEAAGIIAALGGASTERGTVTASNLRIRSGPGTEQGVLGMVPRGTPLEILGREGDWFRVKTPALSGFASAAYVKLDPVAPSDWVGKFQPRGTGWDGTWTRSGRVLGVETLTRVAEGGGLSFAAIDLTSDKDSRDFVTRFRQTFGWRNLIETLPGLKDDAHPGMSLQGGIVSPYGQVVAVNEYTNTAGVTSTVAIQNIATAREWLPTAGVRLSADGRRGQLLGGPETVDGDASFASFVFVSSHGYPSGKVKFVPSFPDYAWFDGTILDVHDLGLGKRWRNGTTRWLMLAMCNVLREEHWESWAAALRDDAGLRGVLGYFRAAPGPEGTRIINERFFDAARQGRPILDAWKYANYEVSTKEGPLTWCALVREDAASDRLDEWTRTGRLPEARPGSRVLYHSTLPAEKAGIPVAKTDGAIATAGITWRQAGQVVGPAEVTRGGGLVPGLAYELEVSLPRPLAADERIELTFVNVRESYWEQHGELDIAKMFTFPEPSGIQSRRGVFPPTPTHTDTLVLDRAKLSLQVSNDILAHVHENEAEIWVKVSVLSATGDVVARGSSITAPLIARRAGASPLGDPAR